MASRRVNPNRGSSRQSSKKYLNLMSMEDFPEDVMWDVLSRLDFKTVSCCKCVCKTWRDLVSDPYFINNLMSSNYKIPSLMIHDTTFDERWRLKWIEIQDKVVEVEKEQLVDAVTIHDVGLPRQFPGFDCHVIIGPFVNGLICVRDTYGLTSIVNPMAKQYLTLPDPHFDSLGLITKLLGYGFGSLDDASYKVIDICKRYLTHASEDEIIQIEVFTLGTKNWRVLQPNDHFNNIGGDMGGGLFFNGRVHWINDGGHQLFVFELDNETFNLFPSPPFEGEENEQKYRGGILGVLKGCLSQGCYYSCEIFTVWIMKQYGMKDSWYKAVTIIETCIYRKLRCPLCLLDGLKGGILIANAGDNLVAYCLQTNTLRTIYLTSSPATSMGRNRTINIQSAMTYHPTFLNLQNFVSPNAPVQTF